MESSFWGIGYFFDEGISSVVVSKSDCRLVVKPVLICFLPENLLIVIQQCLSDAGFQPAVFRAYFIPGDCTPG
jgi:hypothetical protein